WDMPVGSPLTVEVDHGDPEGKQVDRLRDLVVGAGFAVDDVVVEDLAIRMRAHRERTLADTVGSGMRLLVCGLNPSVYAADAGVDARATAGEQAAGFGGTPAYVMPSTSGANAHARLDDLADHLRAAAALSR